MPKIRTLIAGFTIALVGALLTGVSPAHAEMTAQDCKWAPSGWDTAQVCVRVTYFQPNASQYEITRVKVWANSTGDVNRVDFSLILWNDDNQSKWDRTSTLDADNNWDKVYTPDGVRTSVTGSTMTCWGTVYYKQAGSAGFAAGAQL
jgi:hypothetical protein